MKKAVRFEQEGNSLYPLPPDYDQLTADGKRLARINAITLQETATDLVYAWSFFREHYLKPLPEGQWYKPPVHESPPAHYRFVYDIGAFPRNVQGFPRAFGKSKLLKELFLLWSLSRPWMKCVTVKSRDDFVREDFTELMWQLEDNELIINDFGVLKPKRGKGMWTTTRLWLNNGFQLVGRSVMGQLLGFRPHFIAFDDAEFDPAMRISPTLLTENMKYLYYNHVRPMLERKSSVLMLGTLLSRKSFLYHMATATEEDDPRMAFFNRVIIGVEYDGNPTWKEKWDKDALVELKEEMGSAAYAAQMMNEPGSDDERVLLLHPSLGFYTIRKVDDFYESSPLKSEAVMVSTHQGAEGAIEMIERPFGKTVQDMHRIIVADPIRNPSATSDWCCVMCIGVERSEMYNDTWWLLDMKLGRVKDPIFIRWLWEMGVKWNARLVGVEAVSTQKKLVEQVRADFYEEAVETGWTPRVFPINYRGDLNRSKAARIMGLAWRFETNRVKMPRHLCNKHPFSDLLFQINNFTEDLKLLPFDDAIDTLAMLQFVPRPKGRSLGVVDEMSYMDMLEKGLIYYPDGTPIMGGLNMSELTPAALAGIQKNRWRENKAKLARKRPMVRNGRGYRRSTHGF